MRADMKEYAEVENVARKFAEAVREGKGAICRPYFLDSAKVFGYLDGKYQECGADDTGINRLAQCIRVDGISAPCICQNDAALHHGELCTGKHMVG